jgi:hypothetical protein
MIVAAVGLIGTAYLGLWCLWFAAVPTVILLAQLVDKFASLPAPFDDRVAPGSREVTKVRLQFGLRTLLIFVTVAAAFLGLSNWHVNHYCNCAFMVGYYGFPFGCLAVRDGSCDIVSVNIPYLAADVAIGVALALGIAMEAAYLGKRREGFPTSTTQQEM